MTVSHAQPVSDPYARIAAFYDLEHDSYEADLQFYRDLANGSGPTIIEVGCGSGRVTIPLARMGREVTGIDSSAEMLARCRQKLGQEPRALQQRVHVVQADARHLRAAVSGHFALGIISLNTFAHFVTPADRLAVLTELRACLVPGGRLALDLDLMGLRRMLESPGQVWLLGTETLPSDNGTPDEPEGINVAHFASAVPAPSPNAAIVTHFYDSINADGVVHRTMTAMTLGLLTRNEAELTLLHAGYVVEAVYGSYELDSYESDSERAIIVAHT